MQRSFPITLETPIKVVASKRVASVSPDEPATAVRKLIRETRARIALVVDRDGRLLGVITRGDVLVISSRKSNAKARDIMSRPAIVLNEDDLIGDAVKLMLKYDEWYAPVVDSEERAKAVFGLEHAIQRMLDENPEYLESVKLSEIMTRDVETVSADDFVSSVWEKMVKRRYAGFPVVDEKGRLVGIVTQYDILAKSTPITRETVGGPSRGSRIREVMTRTVTYLTPNDTAATAASLMVERGYGRIPIVESPKTKRLVGIVDREDIVRLLYR